MISRIPNYLKQAKPAELPLNSIAFMWFFSPRETSFISFNTPHSTCQAKILAWVGDRDLCQEIGAQLWEIGQIGDKKVPHET
jgi:hypothetical protein